MALVFDIETNDFLEKMTKLWCIGIYDTEKKEYQDYHGLTLEEGVYRLQEAEVIVGHNIIPFDIPAIKHFYPWFRPKGLVRDTIVLGKLFYPHIKDDDYRRQGYPNKLIGSHSLKAWGHRFNEHKGEFNDFSRLTQEMLDYMKQDVKVTAILWYHVNKMANEWDLPMLDGNPPPGKDAIQLEHDVAEIVIKVERHGWRFDRSVAAELVADLTVREKELYDELQETFPPKTWWWTPKANNKRYGNVKGVPKQRSQPFNPGSRRQVAERLQELGWKPDTFNKDGTPSLDDELLTSLPYPEAKILGEYFLVQKRLGQVANGKEAWLVHLTSSGRIHCHIDPGRAHTGRMAHSKPNLAQVPTVHVPYGEKCRRCFLPDVGHTQVGCDADGLEQRTLAGYMARYDGGAYVKAVLDGDKADGSDMHSINAMAIGCDRETAKTFFYALIYGAQDPKLGAILGGSRHKGKRAREALMRGVPALGQFISDVQEKYRNVRFLIGLDGRRVFPKGAHSAMNTLNQNAGAVIMKRALVIFNYRLTHVRLLRWGEDWAINGLIHDEIQNTCRPELAEDIGGECIEAIRAAGKFYSFPCPTDASFKTGTSWEATH
ncbi:MAG: DNA polymerase [bacterium]